MATNFFLYFGPYRLVHMYTVSAKINVQHVQASKLLATSKVNYISPI